MKNSILFTLLLLVGFSPIAMAQTEEDAPLDGVYQKIHVPNAKVTPYATTREADVMFSRRVWRTIDLKEKINLPMVYPRKKLIDVLMDAVIAGELTAYSSVGTGTNDPGDEFKVPMTADEVAEIGMRRDTAEVQDPITGLTVRQPTVTAFDRDDVVEFRLKEDWFFDKQRSIFEPRIIGIAPVRYLRNSSGEIIDKAPIFWVYFAEARFILVNNEVFNRFNDAGRLSFDDLFAQRMFSSYITKTTNVKDERIKDYAPNGMDQLAEAQRIKDDMINFEHDLWEY